MSHIPFDYYKKNLPARFSRGYTSAFIYTFGRSASESYLNRAILMSIQDKEEYKRMFYSLRHILSPSTFEDLDYKTISLLYEGFAYSYDVIGQTTISERMRDVGRKWFLRDDSIVSGYSYESIAEIAENDQFLSRESLFKGDIFDIVNDLFSSFSKESGILFDVILQNGVYVEINIHNCPFCLNHPLPCDVLLGIVEGFLVWLKGNDKIHTNTEGVFIDIGKSKGNKVVIMK